MTLYRIALRNIGRNRRRSFLSGIAVAIAGCAIVFLFGLMAGMLNDMKTNLWTNITGAVRIRNADFDKYERINPMHLAIPKYTSLLKTIQEEPGVTGISPRINFPGTIPVGEIADNNKINAMGVGLDFSTELSYQDYDRGLVDGKLPEMGTREAAMGAGLAKKLGKGVGDKFTVLSQSGTRGSNAYTFTITGILSFPVTALENQVFQVPLDTAQRFLWLPDQVQEILVKVAPKGKFSPKEVAASLNKKLISSVPLNVLEYREINGMAGMMDVAGTIYDIIAIIVFLLASTVIINTTIMVIFERMREIGTLAAMGMTGKQLVKLFFYEALTICVVGSLIGIALGMGITAYLGKVGFSAMKQAMDEMGADMGFSSIIYPVLNFRSTVLVFVYSLAVTAAATWWPSRRAAKILPMEALRYE